MVLGGDAPLGLPLISDLERKGYIVIASVSTPGAADLLERQSHGFVRALVLDPTEVRSVSVPVTSLLNIYRPEQYQFSCVHYLRPCPDDSH